jgi:glutathione S-transferase
MVTVYGGSSTRSFRVLWLLEEMGLPYVLRTVDLLHRGEDAEFLKINRGFPARYAGRGVVMVESIAIMEYLLARYGPTALAPIASDAMFPLYQQFLDLGERAWQHASTLWLPADISRPMRRGITGAHVKLSRCSSID